MAQGAVEQPLSFFNTDQGCLSWPRHPFSQVAEQLPVWEKTQFNRKLFFSTLSQWGEEWGGEGRPKRGEGRVLIKKSGSSARGRVCPQSKEQREGEKEEVFTCLNKTPSWCDLRHEWATEKLCTAERRKVGGGGADGWT